MLDHYEDDDEKILVRKLKDYIPFIAAVLGGVLFFTGIGYATNVGRWVMSLYGLQDFLYLYFRVCEYVIYWIAVWYCLEIVVYPPLDYLFRKFVSPIGIGSTALAAIRYVTMEYIRSDSIITYLVNIEFVLLPFVISPANISDRMALSMIPITLFYAWHAYLMVKICDIIERVPKNYYFLIPVGIANFLFILGGSIARDERTDLQNLVTIYAASGLCSERYLIRSISLGMLFYNPYSSSYEIRNGNEIRAIFPGRQCA